jgi:hypothetical protein
MGGRSPGGGNSRAWSASDKFSDSRLMRKFESHKKEYPGLTQEQYRAKAINLMERKSKSDIKEFVSREEKIIFKYDMKNNDLVLYKDKKVVTLYKPKRGLEYFEDQRRLHG